MEIEGLSLQLRRAYRLVHGYQRAIIDLSHEIMIRLGLDFFCWSPVFNDTPPRCTTDLSRKWSWDLLPGYSIYFAYTTPGPIQPGSYMLILWAEADTGFSKLCEDTKRGEPDFAQLDAPEHCATNFRFWHSVVVDSPKMKDSQGFWAKLWDEDWPETNEFNLEVDGVKMKGRMATHSLSAISSPDDLKERLEEFKMFVDTRSK
ncbi:MAG: hypothetical protein ABI375_00380 [Rudaea sp.]